MKFDVILIDPPVPHEVWSKETGSGRSAASHYTTQSWEWVESLGPAIQRVAAKDCALFLWLCCPLIPETLKALQAWGFKYKTIPFVWVKTTLNERAATTGLGYWARANIEPMALGTIGRPERKSKAISQIVATVEPEVVFHPLGEHSEKPIIFNQKIEKLIVGNRRLEMFARERKSGWTCIGNELDGLDIFESLDIVAKAEDTPILPAIDTPLQPSMFDVLEQDWH